jgi:hypothetical protein
MKRLSLKRLNILSKPTRVSDVLAVDTEEFEDKWLLEAEKIKTKRIRAWRHQLQL